AEDGIRDWSVTGVQTCALPIFVRRGTRPGTVFRLDRWAKTAVRRKLLGAEIYPAQAERPLVQDKCRAHGSAHPGWPNDTCRSERSEERRVGKERRDRWSRDHAK